MKYLSICSGIEAASVAWHPLGWQPVAFSEIEPFPSAVLAHHYPHVPNVGDMTKYKEWSFEQPVDLLVGGTPCQAFSVAGLRQGLADARGNLTLTFVEMADHFNPKWVVWENVPGVLSSKDNAFGCLLAGLCGTDEPIDPQGKWTNAGLVSGPKRTVAWRVLDAQYFGVAQRRRRVFVCAVAGTGNWRAAAALFPVGESVLGDTAPSRKQGQEVAATIAARFGISRNNHEECVAQEYTQSVAKCLTAGGNMRYDFETEDFVAHTLRAQYDASEDGTGRGTPLVPVGFNARQDPDSWTERTGPLDTDGSTQAVAQPMAFDLAQITSAANRTRVDPALPASTLSKGSDMHVASMMAVRRLTPVECERLQGFPDNYTNIPWRKQPESPDGPRYKALGNSMAVPVMNWIGRRIAFVDVTF